MINYRGIPSIFRCFFSELALPSIYRFRLAVYFIRYVFSSKSALCFLYYFFSINIFLCTLIVKIELFCDAVCVPRGGGSPSRTLNQVSASHQTRSFWNFYFYFFTLRALRTGLYAFRAVNHESLFISLALFS